MPCNSAWLIAVMTMEGFHEIALKREEKTQQQAN
jgi:hypothetical protein